jgi:hypothetical protein
MVFTRQSPLSHILKDNLNSILSINETGKVLLNKTLNDFIALLTGTLEMGNTRDKICKTTVTMNIAEEVARMKVQRANTQ